MPEPAPDQQDDAPQGANCCFTAAATFGMLAIVTGVVSSAILRRGR